MGDRAQSNVRLCTTQPARKMQIPVVSTCANFLSGQQQAIGAFHAGKLSAYPPAAPEGLNRTIVSGTGFTWAWRPVTQVWCRRQSIFGSRWKRSRAERRDGGLSGSRSLILRDGLQWIAQCACLDLGGFEWCYLRVRSESALGARVCSERRSEQSAEGFILSIDGGAGSPLCAASWWGVATLQTRVQRLYVGAAACLTNRAVMHIVHDLVYTPPPLQKQAHACLGFAARPACQTV